jgi:hypothetical protein
LRADPTEALVCLVGEPPQKRIAGVHLPRDVASSLAQLIAQAPPAVDPPERCAIASSRLVTLVRFRYIDAAVVDVAENSQTCRAVFIGTHAVSVPQPVADFIAGMSRFMFRATRPAPDLMGLSLAAARAAARRAHLTMERVDVIVDSSVPNASVVLEDPRSDWRQVDVVIAVQPAPRCAIGQLATPHTNPPVDQLSGEVLLSAEYRDDWRPPYGNCLDHIVPSSWQVQLADGRLTVPNGRATADAQPIGSGGLVTCRGRFGVGRIDLA